MTCTEKPHCILYIFNFYQFVYVFNYAYMYIIEHNVNINTKYFNIEID